MEPVEAPHAAAENALKRRVAHHELRVETTQVQHVGCLTGRPFTHEANGNTPRDGERAVRLCRVRPVPRLTGHEFGLLVLQLRLLLLGQDLARIVKRRSQIRSRHTHRHKVGIQSGIRQVVWVRDGREPTLFAELGAQPLEPPDDVDSCRREAVS